MEHLKVAKRIEGFPGGSDGKEYTCNSGHHGVGKIKWRREWLPTSVFLPGELNGQRSLAGYNPWGSQTVRHDCVTNTSHLKNMPDSSLNP